MKVFMSWSGATSLKVALALKDFLESVIQSLEIFVSPEMDRGSIWNTLINGELNEASNGIVCLTRENHESPWILFEAGAIAKGTDQSRVCTFLIDVDPSDLLKSPLAQFNHTKPDKAGVQSLVETLNSRLPAPLTERKLKNAFAKFWPDFKARFDEILREEPARGAKKPAAYRELATETLEALKRIDKSLTLQDSTLADTLQGIDQKLTALCACGAGQGTPEETQQESAGGKDTK